MKQCIGNTFRGDSLANYLLRALTVVARQTMRKHENEIRNNLAIADKEVAINPYHQSLGFVTQSLSNEIKYYFIHCSLVSGADGTIAEMGRQIEAIYAD